MATRNQRACLLCGIVQASSVFRNEGCPNCESVLRISTSEDGVRDCTSPSFEGLVAVGNPGESWVAKWLRIETFTPGLYAVKVNGKLPSDIVSDLYTQNIVYRPRDGSVAD